MAKKTLAILQERTSQSVNPWGIRSQAVMQKTPPDEPPQVMERKFKPGATGLKRV
jgi:hypothetical protein